MSWFKETLHQHWQQCLKIDQILHESQNGLQKCMIFENTTFGRVLTLDGIVQLTERDEFIYHEMFTHLPVFAHGDVKRVLVIGGGDGGIVRELLRHQVIDQIDLVEIDQDVITLSKEFFPMVCQDAFDDPRLTVNIADGRQFLKDTTSKWDLILVDSTDPIGPATTLFEKDFYQLCLNALNPKGILVTQNGSAYIQLEELTQTQARLSALTKWYGFYFSMVPTYVGGNMSHAWATNDFDLSSVDLKTIQQRFKLKGLNCRYYNPKVHVSAFGIPQYILDTFK